MADGDDAVTTIPEMLQYRAHAEEDRDRKSFRFHDRHGFVANLTPSDIYSMAGKFAHLLREWGFKKGEVIANGLPNSPERVVTDFGIIMAGCVLVNCQDAFNNQTIETPKQIWDLVSTTQCQGVALMSNDVIRLIDEYERNPPEHKVMYIATGGETVRQDLYKAVGLLCHFLVVSYGCSEGGLFTVGVIKEPNCDFGDFFSGTVYRNDIHIKVVGEDGNAMDPGEDGEIYVKCDQIIKEYYNVEASSSNPQPRLLTDDGWFRTGDRGKLRSDGRLYCYGRQGDVTSINGVIIYLSWLETILNKCPRVQNSSVIAIEDTDSKDGGVLFCGFVEPKPDSNLTEDEVKEFFAEQIVDTEYKDKLSLAHVFAVDTIPVIPTGKVNKRALKDIAKERLK